MSSLITPSNILFFSPIEKNQHDINSKKQGYTRYYESEAIYCFRELRKFYPDAKIIAMQVTKDKISKTTIKILSEMNVCFIYNYQEITETFKNGYWNIPLVGKIVEKMFPNHKLIKIDLDMYIIKKLPDNWINQKILIGRYDDDSKKHNLNNMNFPEFYGNAFDTGLIICDSNLKFYELYFNTLQNITRDYNNYIMFKNKYMITINEYDEDGMDYGVLEEFAINYIEFKNWAYISYITDYNIGEFYKTSDDYNDLSNIYFLHYHFINNHIPIELVKEKIKINKRIK